MKRREDDGLLETLSRREQITLRELLLATTSVAGHGQDPERIGPLVDAAPMRAVVPAAALHHVSGTVLRGLSGVDGVPSDVIEQLAAVQQQSTLRHLLTVGALSEIAASFDDAGIRWVVMKGPVVAALLYPEVGDRSYADLDLLVHGRDYGRAMQILEQFGFRHEILDWARAEEMLAGQVGMKTDAMIIDLHWHLHYSVQDRRPFALDPEAMIARSRRVDVSGLDVPTFDEVDTLLNLAFHAARSDGHRLVWWKDIECSLRVERPDLSELTRRAHQYRCGPAVGLMLERSRTMLGAEVPHEIVRDLAPLALRCAARIATSMSHPVQLHDRSTVTRALTRSTRSSSIATLGAVPIRLTSRIRRSVGPVGANETGDPVEKARYIEAVAASTGS